MALQLAVNVGRWLRNIHEQQFVGKWRNEIQGLGRCIKLSREGVFKTFNKLNAQQLEWMKEGYRITNGEWCENLQCEIVSEDSGDPTLKKVSLHLLPVGMLLEDLMRKKKGFDAVAVLHTVLLFFTKLHGQNYVYIDLRTANVIFANDKYYVIDLEYVRPEGPQIPNNLRCWDVLEEADFEVGDKVCKLMDLVMLRQLMVDCGWVDRANSSYGALYSYLDGLHPKSKHTVDGALSALTALTRTETT